MCSGTLSTNSRVAIMGRVEPITGRVGLCEVTAAALDLQAHRDAVATDSAGAIATFEGTVRNHDPANPNPVVFLEYQAHPSAGDVLRALAEEFAARDGISAVAVSHRVDARLNVGEAAIVCAVSGPHRREVLDACSELVERIKHELPVWKLQEFADGTQEWVNCP